MHAAAYLLLVNIDHSLVLTVPQVVNYSTGEEESSLPGSYAVLGERYPLDTLQRGMVHQRIHAMKPLIYQTIRDSCVIRVLQTGKHANYHIYECGSPLDPYLYACTPEHCDSLGYRLLLQDAKTNELVLFVNITTRQVYPDPLEFKPFDADKGLDDISDMDGALLNEVLAYAIDANEASKDATTLPQLPSTPDVQ